MSVESMKSKLKKLWEGEESLALTFWLYYFVGVMALSFLGSSMQLAFVSLVAVLWAGFMVMPIWRASDKYPGLKLYSVLAKVAAVLIALHAISGLTSFG